MTDALHALMKLCPGSMPKMSDMHGSRQFSQGGQTRLGPASDQVGSDHPNPLDLHVPRVESSG